MKTLIILSLALSVFLGYTLCLSLERGRSEMVSQELGICRIYINEQNEVTLCKTMEYVEALASGGGAEIEIAVGTEKIVMNFCQEWFFNIAINDFITGEGEKISNSRKDQYYFVNAHVKEGKVHVYDQEISLSEMDELKDICKALARGRNVCFFLQFDPQERDKPLIHNWKLLFALNKISENRVLYLRPDNSL